MTVLNTIRRRAVSAAVAGALVSGLVLAVPAGTAAAALADPAPLPAGATVDQFDSTTLSPNWNINNDDPAHWSLSTTPGSLAIQGQTGDTYQTDNKQKNVFLWDIPVGDFVAQTTVTAPVNTDYQGAGIYAWGDQDNYIRAGLTNVSFAAGGPTVIENGKETAAVYSSTFTARAGVTQETLRVSRAGNVITTAYWSGTAWVTADTQTVTFNTTKVGLYAFGSTGGVNLNASFDYFAVKAADGAAVVPAGVFALETSAAQKYLAANGNTVTAVADRPRVSPRFTATASGSAIVLGLQGSNKVLAVGTGGTLGLVEGPAAASAQFQLRDIGGGKNALFSVADSANPLRVGVLAGALSTGAAATPISITTAAYANDGRQIDVDADGATKEISDHMYGIFYEDINYAADGGLYAELVRNRSFEFNSSDRSGYTGLTGWNVLQRGGATGTGTVVTDAQMLNAMNRYYLQLNITAAGTGAGNGVGIRNTGWNTGIFVEQGKTYDFSVWARRTADFDKPLTVKVEDTAGTTTFAQGQVTVTGDTWKKYTVRLTATGTTTIGALTLVAEGGAGTVRLDMVSLFPTDTFKGRPNGLRKDLAEKIDALHPKFLRFPGGCVTNVGTFRAYGEAGTYDRKRTYQWKETVGPVEERPTNFNFWGYNQTYGLGYLEYLEFAEDIGAKPVPVLSVGINGCGGVAPTTYTFDIDRWVQDTLDLIEFANGDASTVWGAKRIAMGHPQPFNLEYVGLGNEENYTAQFQINFPKFQDAIKLKYPNIKIISNSGPDASGTTFDTLWAFNRNRNVEVVDEHYYRDPAWFLENNKRYDSYPRTGPKVFLGEYASRGNTLYNALSEASYMTALERNADVVKMASYAPLLAMDHASYAPQWTPDMIWFDNSRIYGSANYYAQQMFMNNVGNEVVPSTYAAPATPLPDIAGGVLLSTWSTAAVYDDVKVTDNTSGAVKFADDFSGTAANWTGTTGTWAINGAGEYAQTSTTVTDARRTLNVAGSTDWSNYTLEVKARKTAGAEGFLVGFAVKDSANYYWWNLGGFANARSLVEKAVGGAKSEIVGSTTKITTGQNYAIKIVVSGHNVKLYLDGVLINEFTEAATAADPLYQVVTRDTATGDLLVKVVNVRDSAVRTKVAVAGNTVVGNTAAVSELSGARTDTNSFATPTKVATKKTTITGTGNSFDYDFPANSITILRLPTSAPVTEQPSTTTAVVADSTVSTKEDLVVTATVAAPAAFSGKAQLFQGSTKIDEKSVTGVASGSAFAGVATFREAGSGLPTGKRQYTVKFVSDGAPVKDSASAAFDVEVFFFDTVPGSSFYTE
ncbi:DUF1349 domain-containing protein, partial [Nakamurella silvestris]